MKIKISDNYSVEKTHNYWTVTETYMGKGRDGIPKEQSNEYYFSQLKHVFMWCLEREIGDVNTLNELKGELRRIENRFVEIIKSKGLK